jgi:pyridoxal phosphate enzyme (YggS family)
MHEWRGSCVRQYQVGDFSPWNRWLLAAAIIYPTWETTMIKDNVAQILSELPSGVLLVAAAKTRNPDEIRQALAAGVTIIGENYVQEAKKAHSVIGKKARWHLIGHLQRNKARKAVEIFDMIETVDSLRLALKIDEECARSDRVMPVLIEVNSGREPQKTGSLPEEVPRLLDELASLEHLKVEGLMTMGPRFGDPEDARPYFVESKKLFDELRSRQSANIELKYLSMGMSNSYHVAIEEGANIVRIGTKLFGER